MISSISKRASIFIAGAFVATCGSPALAQEGIQSPFGDPVISLECSYTRACSADGFSDVEVQGGFLGMVEFGKLDSKDEAALILARWQFKDINGNGKGLSFDKKFSAASGSSESGRSLISINFENRDSVLSYHDATRSEATSYYGVCKETT